MKNILFGLSMVCLALQDGPAFAETRSFGDVFPFMSAEQKTAAFSKDGFTTSSKVGVLSLQPISAGLNVKNNIARRNFPYVTEYLIVLPFKNASLLDIYNALGRIRDLKGRLYHSATKDKDVPLFEDATRVSDERRTTPIPDPGRLAKLPDSETIYIKLKDQNFGNTFYRADIVTNSTSIICTLTNFRSFNFFFIPVIQANNFSAQLYVEPVREGILIYSVAGTEVSDFVAKHVDMNSAIKKRLDVLDAWIIDGIR